VVTIANHGLDSVEVRDNGKGLPSEHYCDVAERYTTSKLVDMDDLNRLSSFGFRGEGLNSLCSVAKMSAITRTSSDATAMLLSFGEQGTLTAHRFSTLFLDHISLTPELSLSFSWKLAGELLAQLPVAGGVGTTFKMSELFHSLPVRRNDLIRNSSTTSDRYNTNLCRPLPSPADCL